MQTILAISKKVTSIYYNKWLVIEVINVNFLSECLLCDVNLDKKGYSSVLYRSSSQTRSAFSYFLSNFENMLQIVSGFKEIF